MTKPEREQREFKSLFMDERYAKKAWRKFISESLESDAAVLPLFQDARGNTAPQSEIYDAAVKSIRERLKRQGIDREPMKAEVIVEANVIQAAFNNQAFTTILDRTAGKVKDEINVSSSAYEDLTDDELQLLIKFRETKQLGDPNDNTR